MMQRQTLYRMVPSSKRADDENELIRGLERQNEKLRQMYVDLQKEHQQLKEQLLIRRPNQ